MDKRVISAQQSLRSFENSAAFSRPHSDSTLDDARDLENLDDVETPVKHSYYTGSSSHKSPKLKSPKNLKGKLKKTAPAAILIGLLFAVVFFLFGSMSFLGAQIETLLTRATDTMFGSYTTNSVRVTTELLAGERGEFPEYMEKRLNNRNIEVIPQEDGSYHLLFVGNTITSENFKAHYDNDPDFRDAFTAAKRGRSTNFFDGIASLSFAKLSLSRNLFRDFNQSGNHKTDSTTYRNTQSEVFEGGTNTSLNTVTNRDSTAPDGSTHTETVASGENINSKNITGDTPRAKAASYLNRISSRVSEAGGVTCAALKVGNLLATAIAVNEIYQAINFFINQEENISKTLAGEGEKAGANFLFNDLSEEKTTTYIDVKTGEEKTVTGSALEAEGFAGALAGEKINTSKTSHYSAESGFTTVASVLSAVSLTAVNNKICGGVRVSGAVISLVSFAVGGALVNSIISLASKVAVNATLSLTISSMLSALIPRVAMSLFTNTFDSLEGVPHGETYVKGADLLNAELGRRTSAQLYATESTAAAYNSYTTIAAAQEAELDRRGRSPLDISSPNTFLGSLIGKFAIIGGTTNIFSTITKTASIVSSATSHISSNFLPNTYARLENVSFKNDDLAGVEFKTNFQSSENCQNLTSIGAACDPYGVGIPATDVKVINVSSSDPTYQYYVNKNVRKNSQGYSEVIEGSTLSKKIKYCDNRNSPPGVLDANIINDFEKSLGVLDYVPVISDVVDMVSAISTASDEAEGWGLASYCVLNPDTNPYYEELIYLQHYEEDQRIASQMKLKEVTDDNGRDQNPITAYLEAYEAANPLNTSDPASILSYYTGFAKEDAELALDLLNYVAFLEDYTPPSTLPSDDAESHPKSLAFNPSSFFTFEPAISEKYIIYNTLREKHHAA